MAAPSPHPGNDYYVQPSTGTIQRQSNPILALALKASLWQGPMTWDAAQGVLDLNKKVAQSGKAPIVTTTAGLGNPPVPKIPNPLSGWTIGGISGHNLMIRGLKIIIGGVLLVAGIMKLTGADREALGVVTQTAGKLPGV